MSIDSGRDVRPRIGVTMRVVEEPLHGELRDALAHDWVQFISAALPEALWMPIPNSGVAARELAKEWALDGLILTGGDDIGVSAIRDETERALLDHFLSARLPVFGVCRGLQMIQTHFGGKLVPCPRGEHVAQRHSIRFSNEIAGLRLPEAGADVNSYHAQGIRAGDLASPLVCLAEAGGWAEAGFCLDPPVAGVMWHPEREETVQEFDRAILRSMFAADVQLAVRDLSAE